MFISQEVKLDSDPERYLPGDIASENFSCQKGGKNEREASA